MRVPGVPRSPKTRQFLPLNFEPTALIQRKASPAGHKPASRAIAASRQLDSLQKPDSLAAFSGPHGGHLGVMAGAGGGPIISAL
jgi:hypothetical protein